MSDTVVIAATNLTKRYRRLVAVDRLDRSWNGEKCSASWGLTARARARPCAMVGLARPSSGSVSILGRNVWRNHEAALQKVGALIEAPAFYGDPSARDNLRLLANAGRARPERDRPALDMVGLLARASGKVKSYSQGMRQRLGIALAIIGNTSWRLLAGRTH